MGAYLLHGLETECSYALHGSSPAGGRALGRAWIDSCGAPPPALEAWIHHHHLDGGEIWLSKGRAQGDRGWLVQVRDIAQFHIEPDRMTVHCHPHPGSSSRDIAYVTENQLLPLLASLQGLPLVHGAAIQAGDRAALFLGATGRGKSTLALSFAGSGEGRLLSDDCTAFAFEHEDGLSPVSVLPSGAPPRLWPDSYAGLLSGAEHVAPGSDYSPKLQLTCAPEAQEFDVRPFPLTALFLIGEPLHDDVRSVSLETISPMEASLALVRHGLVFDPGDANTLVRQFRAVTAVAQRVPAFALHYRREFGALPAVRSAILKALDGAPGPERADIGRANDPEGP